MGEKTSSPAAHFRLRVGRGVRLGEFGVQATEVPCSVRPDRLQIDLHLTLLPRVLLISNSTLQGRGYLDHGEQAIGDSPENAEKLKR